MKWSGTFTFGDTWAAYTGYAAQTSLHAHAAIQLIVGTSGDFIVTDELNREITGPLIVVKPAVKHMLCGNGSVSVLYIEPLSPIAFALENYISSDEITCLPQRIAARIDVAKHPSTWLSWLTEDSRRDEKIVDSRLSVALDFLSTPEPGHTIKLAAAKCGLSASRLRVLALQQLGFPLSTWLIWRKLARASQALSKDATLAEAAYQGGFADQSHFSRTMRRMFGVSPSEAGGILHNVR